MGKKRRGSQAFAFEQSEETLLQNENILKLYKNQTFEPPEPRALETIREEGNGDGAKRAKRGESEDGSLVLGLFKARRIISDYKFWKQDDKEKNRKRKLKISKQWKGRKRPKPKSLDCALEQKLIDLIADRVSSDEEDSDEEENPNYLSRQCVWAASDSLSATTSHSASGSVPVSPSLSSDQQVPSPTFSPQCFSEPDSSLKDLEFLTGNDQPSDDEEAPNENDVLSELQGLVPESELAELLQCEDFLFCSKQRKDKSEPDDKVKVNSGSENKNEKKDTRRSVRRSARIMCVPNLNLGSVFTADGDRDLEEQENLNPREKSRGKKAKTLKKSAESENGHVLKKKTRTRKCTPQGGGEAQHGVLKDLSNQEDSQGKAKKTRKEDPKIGEKRPSEEDPAPAIVKSKRRKSYSLEDGGSRYSLDGSRRNR